MKIFLDGFFFFFFFFFFLEPYHNIMRVLSSPKINFIIPYFGFCVGEFSVKTSVVIGSC
jgi:hypothetical protein